MAGTIDLAGKCALVTGAGTRVGAAVAVALGAQRMRVAVHYHGSEAGAAASCRVIEAAGGEAFSVCADLRDEVAARALVRDVVARLGGLDLLVASAANYDETPFERIAHADWHRALALNLLAPFFLVQQAAHALAERAGSVVLITCGSRHAPHKHRLPYQVSKAALHHMMRVLAVELAPGVRVNAVAPGTVLPPTELSAEQLKSLVSRIALGHVGTEAAVADAVVFLARSPFVTGTELVVDGGRALT